MKRVLFLCSGNSCRSQMAEAIVNHFLAADWSAFSAGTNPTGFVHPMVLNVLHEIGIDHDGRSKSVDEFRHQIFDWVITVCDAAAGNCPVWLGEGQKQHIPFEDPAATQGDDDEIQSVFRTVRDRIKDQILPLLIAQQ